MLGGGKHPADGVDQRHQRAQTGERPRSEAVADAAPARQGEGDEDHRHHHHVEVGEGGADLEVLQRHQPPDGADDAVHEGFAEGVQRVPTEAPIGERDGDAVPPTPGRALVRGHGRLPHPEAVEVDVHQPAHAGDGEDGGEDGEAVVLVDDARDHGGDDDDGERGERGAAGEVTGADLLRHDVREPGEAGRAAQVAEQRAEQHQAEEHAHAQAVMLGRDHPGKGGDEQPYHSIAIRREEALQAALALHLRQVRAQQLRHRAGLGERPQHGVHEDGDVQLLPSEGDEDHAGDHRHPGRAEDPPRHHRSGQRAAHLGAGEGPGVRALVPRRVGRHGEGVSWWRWPSPLVCRSGVAVLPPEAKRRRARGEEAGSALRRPCSQFMSAKAWSLSRSSVPAG